VGFIGVGQHVGNPGFGLGMTIEVFGLAHATAQCDVGAPGVAIFKWLGQALRHGSPPVLPMMAGLSAWGQLRGGCQRLVGN